jgi:S-adenosylmethionine hydrolase
MPTHKNTDPVIALLTDFGTTDPYVGSLKAALYNVTRNSPVIDISHYIRPQNVLQAAFILRMVYRDYPKGTIFVCVVDPGVGGPRLPIAVQTDAYYFIGPDNGLFSYVYERETVTNIVTLSNKKLWRHPVSDTFHGRDIFAPCAAHLSQSKQLKDLGPHLGQDPCSLKLPTPSFSDDSTLEGEVMHIDRFGNLISNIHKEDLENVSKDKTAELSITDWDIPFGQNYETIAEEALTGLWGSSGFLEIAARNGSARDVLDCEFKESVRIHFTESK